ncbi:multicopper oxidase family protein [Microbispora sp. RL4-1S]|uniref:Copper-containing nitrite reductase n=1 Tax=Microbispora oryzae TaxID=2806554 RepID=A0A940WKG0_9ACTN|nr:multicopper oxidase family protein [Microbispora oryzae]MBP2705542.1 multicopper oxidase family protein [Microbispora oryzae]
MTTDRLMVLDLLVAVVTAALWAGAGVTAAARRPRAAAVLFAGAVAASLARAWSVIALAGAGWWFVQEKVTFALPLLLVATVAAAAVAGPRLLSAVRRGRPGDAGAPAVVVPLLAAAYAGAAGPIQTFLLGYPATVSRSLILLAVVAAAVLVTWRAVAARVPRPRTLTGATTGVALLGVVLAVVPSGSLPDQGRPGDVAAAHQMSGMDMTGGPARPVTGFRGPTTPAPGGRVRDFTLTARTATVTLSSGRRISAWTFDGRVPGPPLTAVQGDLIEVRLRNADIAQGVTLHWHGYDVPSGEDGVPGLTQDAVMPGQEFVYRFRADQAGTFWYHTHEVSNLGVRMGLYGTLVVAPRAAPASGVDLTLPVHTFAGSTVVGDADRPLFHQVAPGTTVRLRLINTDNTPHRFTLAGTPYRLVAVDGADLNGPGELSRTGLRLPAGGRYDLAFTTPPGQPGQPVVLRVDDRTVALRLGERDAPDDGTVTTDTTAWPELDITRYGTPAPTPFSSGSRFDRRFTLVLDRGVSLAGGRLLYAYTVNGGAFPDIPPLSVADGDLVRFTVVNRGNETHPWHLHGHRVLVLSRNGRAPTGAPLWLDTFDVRPGEVWEVAFRADNPGLWMNHCHNLSHADQGMVLHLEYEGVTTPFHGAHGG